MTRIPAALAAAALAAFFMPVAQAQLIPVVCRPHAEITTKLEKQYGEVLVGMGLSGEALFEVYASAKGTFTVLLTRPGMKGLTCIQGAGTDFVWTGNEYPKKEKPA